MRHPSRMCTLCGGRGGGSSVCLFDFCFCWGSGFLLLFFLAFMFFVGVLNFV